MTIIKVVVWDRDEISDIHEIEVFTPSGNLNNWVQSNLSNWIRQGRRVEFHPIEDAAT